MMSKPLNLQDAFLYQLKKHGIPACIHVINGYEIKNAIIIGYDSYSILCTVGSKQMLLYKHALSSIAPSCEISLERSGE